MRGCDKFSLDGRIWLSDRGINEAINEGLIRGVEPYPLDGSNYTGQIRPTTIDLLAEDPVLILPHQVRKVRHVPLDTAEGFEISADVRSGIRRNNLAVPEYSPVERAFTIANFSNWGHNYMIGSKDRFCQAFVGGAPDSFVSEFDHGVPADFKKMMELIAEGHIKETNRKKLKVTPDGHLILHASDRLIVSHYGEEVGAHERTILATKDKPMTKIEMLNGHPFPTGKVLRLSFRESLEVSEHVTLQIYFLHRENVQLGGIVDPGYRGDLLYMPLVLGESRISSGDVIGLGRAIYYRNPVLIPYDKRKDSRFQGTLFNDSPTFAR